MGFSEPDMPEVRETPKAEITKPVSEAATTARQAQKEKANKAAGLRGSILTSDLNNGGNNTLG